MTVRVQQSGFTLIEVAIVLLVVAILLGFTVAMLPVQQELKQYRSANDEMDSIIEHLIGFAQVNGRLPCPDTSTDNDADGNSIDGLEDPHANASTGCEAFFGFLPGRTLGINGRYNDDGILTDPWGQGYGYAVSNADRDGVSGDGNPDLVTANGIRTEGLAAVVPDLQVCDDSQTTGTHANCAATTGGNTVISNVAAVIVSLGRDYTLPPGTAIQEENTDGFNDGTADKVYVYTSRSDNFDDVVKWIPRSLLFSRMLDAEQLP